ncbi:MAG: nucleotide exchange factor GrpE [bacterium]|nr:nucleotide exchange factor GrpE [bacterium]MDE0668901.1 nucleotide exchange factor GrpE [bacterium]
MTDAGDQPPGADGAAGGEAGDVATDAAAALHAEAAEADSGSPAVPGDDADAPGCGHCAEYLDALTRLKAEFTNFRRRAADQQAQASERGAAELARGLLAVLDATEAGAAHDSELVGPLHSALLEALTSGGLEVISPAGERFDPNYHEAVQHTAAGDAEEPAAPVVTDVLRTGYGWSGRVLRPAVVSVAG